MSQNYEYFGKYILLEKLATGGMAEVWLARAPGAGGIGKFVAIKKILPQFSDNPEFIQMFRDEATIAMNLSHGNIVSIYEFGQEAQQLFLVMDYVEGRNLRQILNKLKNGNQRLNGDQIVYMVREVASGLDHAHRSLNSATGRPLNITHRDMSPQNVMVSFEGEVKIVDFGIAKAEVHMENTRAGTIKGKFGYMSPEQAEGHPTDLRTDIFSLGIILWELLANDRLFIANNEINTLRKIRECNVPSLSKINPNINPELERIVMKALTRDRNLRYQTSAAFHRDLSRFMNRQYPDFSPHDFAVFIKTAYADEIMETRKRIIDYSKIPFKGEVGKQSFVSEDKTQITTFPQTSTTESEIRRSNETQNPTLPTHSIDPKTLTQTIPTNEPSIETAFEVSASYSTKPAPDNLLRPDVLMKNMNTRLEGAPDQTGTQSEAMDVERATGTHPRPIPHRAQSHKRKSSPTFVDLLFFIAFTIATYLVSITFFPQQTDTVFVMIREMMSKSVKKPAPPAPPAPKPKPIALEEPPVEVPVAATEKALIVNSDPSGAQVYIDGNFVGKSTPARVAVPLNRAFQLKLVKERYIEYIRSDIDPNTIGRSISANLQKAFIAYVDIDVLPAQNVRIFVDGKHLKDEKVPISRYAIPAGKDIVVRAENALSGESITRTIKLREDERFILRLNFEGERKPSGK